MIKGQAALDKSLADLLGSVKPGQRKKAIRKALAHLRKINRANIKAQRNPDGSAYTPRQRSSDEGKTAYHYDTGQVFIDTQERQRGKSYITLKFSNGQYIRLKKDRIDSQRKIRAKKKKMLTGFAKQLQTRQFGANKGVLNYPTGSRKLARIHHFGRNNQKGRLPARQLIGLSNKDRQEVYRIMKDVLLGKA